MWKALFLTSALLTFSTPAAAPIEPTMEWVKLHNTWMEFIAEYCQCPAKIGPCDCQPSAKINASKFFEARRAAAKVFDFKECK